MEIHEKIVIEKLVITHDVSNKVDLSNTSK